MTSSSSSQHRGVLKPNENPKQISKEEWKKRLDPLAYLITRESETERPFTGKFDSHFEKGYYTCVCCGEILFDSSTKFKTSCGWPGFHSVKKEEAVVRKEDKSFNLSRTEVLCSKCNAHLGHVFKDGPKPSGERFCINSVCLEFHGEKPQEKN